MTNGVTDKQSYDKETGTGGSNGATMRFAPESEHGANSGLKNARAFLEPVKCAHRHGQPFRVTDIVQRNFLGLPIQTYGL